MIRKASRVESRESRVKESNWSVQPRNTQRFLRFLGGAVAVLFLAIPFESSHLLASGESSSQGEIQVERGHPRIFFTARDLSDPEGVRSRCVREDGTFGNFREITEWCRETREKVFDIKTQDFERAMVVFAFAHAVTEGDRDFGRKAVALALEAPRHEEARNPSFRWESLPRAISITYDWCYELLSEDERTEIVLDLLRRGIYVREVVNRDSFPTYTGPRRLSPLVFAGIALFGENGATERVGEWLSFVRKALIEGVLAARDEAGWQGSWYSSDRQSASEQIAIAEMLEAWLSATGEDLFSSKDSAWPLVRESGSRHLRGAARAWLYSTRPDFSSEKKGDSWVVRPPIPAWHIFHLAFRYRDSHAQAFGFLLSALAKKSQATRRLSYLEDLMKEILWEDERNVTEDLTLPLSAFFEDTGNVYIRSGWNFGPESSDVWAAFRAETGSGEELHRHQGHLGICRGKDALLIDSGCFDPESPLHLENYFRKSIAHNVLYWEKARERIGASPLAVGSVSSRESERGVISAYTDQPLYTYACANTSLAYEPGSIWEARRQIVYLKNERLFLVADRAYSPQRSFLPAVLWHSIEEPLVAGERLFVEGKEGQGISEFRRSTSFLIRRGESKLVGRWLYPSDGVVRKIGGDGYRFYSEEKDFAPGGSWTLEALERNEAGAWRLEFRPRAPSNEQMFLFLLAVRDRNESSDLEVEFSTPTDAMDLAVKFRGNLSYRVSFGKLGKASGTIEITGGEKGISEAFPEERIGSVVR